MQIPQFKAKQRPKYSIGQKVWYIPGGRRPEPKSDTVYAINLALMRDPDSKEPNPKLLTVGTGYRLGDLNLDSLDSSFKGYELYESLEAAQKDAAWTDVDGFTEANWRKMIGWRYKGHGPMHGIRVGLDGADLFACCANISDARGLLENCRDYGGMTARDIRYLKELLEACGNYSMSTRTKKPSQLARVLKQLGITLEAKA